MIFLIQLKETSTEGMKENYYDEMRKNGWEVENLK